MNERDPRRAVGVVLDRRHLSRHVLLVAHEIDRTVRPLVAAPAVAPVVNVISTTAPVADTVPATIEPQPEATAPVETVVETAPTPAPSEAPVAPSEPVVSQ